MSGINHQSGGQSARHVRPSVRLWESNVPSVLSVNLKNSRRNWAEMLECFSSSGFNESEQHINVWSHQVPSVSLIFGIKANTKVGVEAVRIEPVGRRWATAETFLILRFSSVWQQSTAAPQTFSMPVTVQSSNQSPLQFSNPGNALVTTSDVASPSLTDAHLLSPQQPALQRNTVSPGLPQRPASAGEQTIPSRTWGLS